MMPPRRYAISRDLIAADDYAHAAFAPMTPSNAEPPTSMPMLHTQRRMMGGFRYYRWLIVVARGLPRLLGARALKAG